MKKNETKEKLADLTVVRDQKKKEYSEVEIHRMGLVADMAVIESQIAGANARLKRLDFEIVKTEHEMNKLIRFK